MNKLKKLFLITSLAFAGVNLLVFLTFFIPNYVFEESTEIIEYTRIFLTKFAEFALPTIAASILFKICFDSGIKSIIKGAVIFALPRIVYLLPYYYLYHIAFGYDSIESISLSALVTVFGVAINALVILALFFIARLLATNAAMKPIIAKLPPKVQQNLTKETKSEARLEAVKSLSAVDIPEQAFDLQNPITLGIFGAAFSGFGINLLSEIIDTVTYLVDYAGYYRMDEIIYIVVCYLFLMAELFATHLIAHFIWRRISCGDSAE